jgi:23S rRNA (uracil1939-C5)-methyltransferase
VINGDKLPHEDKLRQALLDAVNEYNAAAGQGDDNGEKKSEPEIVLQSFVININRKATNKILGEKTFTLYGADHIIDYIGDIKFQISAQSFYQVNPLQTYKLYSRALEYADLSGQEKVWDLYCGIGTISLFLSQKAKMVYGVEIVPQAVEDAKQNAEINEIANVEFHVGSAEEVAAELEDDYKADVVVVDPPRKGCDVKLLDTIIQMSPKRVVYVSCNPATLARDMEILRYGGFKVKRFSVFDQFSRGMHVETVMIFEKNI